MPRKRKGGDPSRKHSDEPPRSAGRGAGHDAGAKAEKGVRPPGDDPPRYSELILAAHAANLAEAQLFKTELEAHGIPAVLEGEGAGVAGIPDVGAGVPVLVPEEFADQAAELIAELEAAKPEGAALDENEEFFEGEAEEEDKEEIEELDTLDSVDEVEDEDVEDDEDLDEDEEELEEDEEEEDEWEEDEEEDWDDDEEEWEDDDDDF